MLAESWDRISDRLQNGVAVHSLMLGVERNHRDGWFLNTSVGMPIPTLLLQGKRYLLIIFFQG